MERKYAAIFLDNGNCEAWWILHDKPLSAGYRSGFTSRNIQELVDVITSKGYHVTLYRVVNPEFHVKNETGEG